MSNKNRRPGKEGLFLGNQLYFMGKAMYDIKLRIFQLMSFQEHK